MKMEYINPELEVVKFSQEDILMASSETAPQRSRGFMESEEIDFD